MFKTLSYQPIYKYRDLTSRGSFLLIGWDHIGQFINTGLLALIGPSAGTINYGLFVLSGLSVLHSIFDFQTPGTSAPAPASDKPGMSSPGALGSNHHPDTQQIVSTLGSQKHLTKSQEGKLQLQAQGRAAILPTWPGDAFVFGPAPVFVYTQERITPHPPPSTELLDLDPNSPHARGLCHKYNIKVLSDDSIGDCTGVVAKVVQQWMLL
ncbi:uncharacterized protein LACBIDRAFT_332889 [Laccaria bicolor S238N-H82]|uniref:Predicted protein n=1 Tax=Laccaria bicolor (strain S238N-H82 / ATCC MYA-4686) TaxID=486041 RepID=B0DU62_LACBS|nr:uncharacterized protein LACBIDRAFT_332889 [Laccaria bicolor S238N-H82]EDR01848.1 predicted protein [Laccaria bicolor S238N-H82]|eukprot:XP_001887458.1 predicted protein [Laccaria bicolor S238N-H82]